MSNFLRKLLKQKHSEMITFEQMGLSAPTLEALNSIGFINPTPIQEQSIPRLLATNTDLLGLAQTGTGKTAAFSLPILEKIDQNNKNPQAIILCPTRELCLQITADIQKFGQNYPKLNTVAIYGGASIINQIRELRRGSQIIVATPGRMLDVIDRGEVNLNDIKIAVLDEADEMLNMGFKDSITQILSNTPDEKNTWLFTATMPKEIKVIANKFMNNPVEVKVAVNTGNENIEHQYYLVAPHNRYNALKRLVDYNPEIFGIVFCRTKNEAKEIADKLIRDGYNSDALHGDLTQQQRDIVMNRYRERSLQMLIATDVAARGIDVSDVTHVINFGLPDDLESYTHRSGRTARAGKKGVSISIITKRDASKIYEVEKMIGKKFIKSKIPSGYEVCEKQLFAIVENAKNVDVNEDQLAPYIDKLEAAFEGMTKEDVIKRFASIEFNRFLTYYQNSEDLNLRDLRNERGERPSRSEKPNGMAGGTPSAQQGYTRFFINLGQVDDLNRGDLLRIVCDNSGVQGSAIGRIDMKEMFSFFEVENRFANQILPALKSFKAKGRNVRVDVASNYGGGRRNDGGGERNFSGSAKIDYPKKEFISGNGRRESNYGKYETFRKTEKKSEYQEIKPKKRENKFPYDLGDF